MNIGEMQRKLSQWATQDQERRFYGLHDLICREDWLRLAWFHVGQNAGSKTAGCDGMDMGEFEVNLEGNLDKLRSALQSGTFEAYPVLSSLLKRRLMSRKLYSLATIKPVLNKASALAYYHYRALVPDRALLARLEGAYSLGIEVTNICNANCTFCAYQYQERPTRRIDEDTFRRAVAGFVELGGGTLGMGSLVGDPLLDPHFVERARYARSHPEITGVVTVTNCIHLDKVGAKELLTSGVTAITVSTTGFDAEMYKRLYRSNQSERMKNNLLDLLRTNRDLGRPVWVEVGLRIDRPARDVLSQPGFEEVLELAHLVSWNSRFDSWSGRIKAGDLSGNMRPRPDWYHLIEGAAALPAAMGGHDGARGRHRDRVRVPRPERRQRPGAWQRQRDALAGPAALGPPAPNQGGLGPGEAPPQYLSRLHALHAVRLRPGGLRFLLTCRAVDLPSDMPPSTAGRRSGASAPGRTRSASAGPTTEVRFWGRSCRKTAQRTTAPPGRATDLAGGVGRSPALAGTPTRSDSLGGGASLSCGVAPQTPLTSPPGGAPATLPRRAVGTRRPGPGVTASPIGGARRRAGHRATNRRPPGGSRAPPAGPPFLSFGSLACYNPAVAVSSRQGRQPPRPSGPQRRSSQRCTAQASQPRTGRADSVDQTRSFSPRQQLRSDSRWSATNQQEQQ
jgi:hypothetical protein